MAKRALSTLKSFFLTGLYPNQSEFHDLLDSFVHKDDGIGVSQVDGLAELLNGKYPQSSATLLENRVTNVEGSVTNLQRQITDLGTIKKRSYTIDFNTDSELSQDSNLLGEITIDRILTKNVTELYVSYGSVVRQQVPTSGTVSLSIPDGVIITWEIVRSIEGELACVGIRFEILMEE